MTVRLARSIALAGLLACSVGCLRAHGPTSFPNWGYFGDVVRTHGKPAGGAYFRDFDPKACRLELTPTNVSNRPGSQQVLIATVYDADGEPRRSRRVEWIIDGPGYIVEVDESGWLPGRGYKVDNKYAVSHTDYREHKITRGNDDPSDDFTVRAGQTWCVVSCAVEGQTTVTAYAPEVFDWDNGRRTVKLVWSEADFGFPAPVTSRSGGEAELRTTLHRFNGKELPDGLRVRYRVLDGAPAVLVPKSGNGTTVTASGGQRETEVAADADGHAAVVVTQPEPKAGTTRIAVEVLKPDGGLGSGTVVGRKETTVEWGAAKLALDVQAPKSATPDREANVSLALVNTGKADGPAATVRVVLPEGVEYVRAEPAPVVQQGRYLTWTVPGLPPGQKQAVALTVRPTRRSPFTLTATAETAEGVVTERRVSVDVGGSGGLKVSAEVPDSVGVGERFTAAVVVRNPGTSAVENVTAWVTGDTGLSHESGKSPAEVPVGTVPAGETKRVEVPLRAAKAGRFTLRVNATADGGLADRAEVGIDAAAAGKLAVVVTGPEQLGLGQEGIWELRVTNSGAAAVSDVVARLSLPKALTAKSATDGGRLAQTDGAEWQLGAIPAGGKKSVRLTAVADRATERGVVAATAVGGSGGRAQGSGESTIAVAGRPALVLEMGDAPASVRVGGRTSVRITVRNRGTGPAKNVEVSASGSDGLAVSGTGADRKPGTVDGKKVTFGVLPELAAGSSAVFVVDLEGSTAGPARVQAEVRADDLARPLREEQATRVVAGG